MGDHSPESQVYAFDVPPATATMIIDGSYGDAEARLDSQRSVIAALAAQGPALFPVPADGRASDIAIFLREAGFDVAIDDAVRSVAKMLTQTAHESARGEIIPSLEALIANARRLGEDARPQGVMIAHGGSGDAGVAGALIKRWKDTPEPQIIFTGHLAAGTTGRKLVDSRSRHFQALERASDARRQSCPSRKRRSQARHSGVRGPEISTDLAPARSAARTGFGTLHNPVIVPLIHL